MSWIIRKFAASFVTLIVITIAVLIFFNYLNRISINEEFENLDLQGLKSTAKVIRHQTSGINKIVAENEKDAYFMVGYLHAKDRLFQMDINRRLIKGELSEVLGKEFLSSDKLFRTLGLKEIIKNSNKVIDWETKQILQSYSNGINEYIRLHKNKLHLGFTIYDYQPTLWKIEDCVAIQRLFALNYSIGFQLDLLMGQIAEKIGINQVMELIPKSIYDPPYIYNESTNDSVKFNSKLSNNGINHRKYLTLEANKINLIYNTITNDNKQFGNLNYHFGCNSWALKKYNKTNEPVILSNDFHSEPTLPSMWYQIHISFSSKHIVGLTIPGLPFVIVGRNKNITWGITNSMLDDCDYFIEKLSDNKKQYYRNNDRKLGIKFIKDTILIKNDEAYVYYISKLDKANIIEGSIDDLSITQSLNSKKINTVSKSTLDLSWQWTGQVPSDELSALRKLSQASNFSEFKNSFVQYSVPCLNYTYGDKFGNYAMLTVGRIPNRNINNTKIIPNPAWLEEYNWADYGLPGIKKTLFNPSKQFVASANNSLEKNSHLSMYFDLPFRANRIENMLNEFLSIENYIFENFDAQRMQMDVLSLYSKEIINEIKPIFEKNSQKLSQKEMRVFNSLKNWDNLFSANRTQPSFFNLYMKRLIINTFQDEIGEENLNRLIKYYQYPYGKLLEVLKMNQSAWFDNANTNNVETRAYIVITSFLETLVEIENLYQTDIHVNWQYSKFHTLMPISFLSSSKLLKPLTEVSPAIIGGDYTTILRTEWNWNNPFEVTLAPSMRMISDMSSNSILFSIPGGTSSEPLSKYYSNQLHLWENGGYIKHDLNPKTLEDYEVILECY